MQTSCPEIMLSPAVSAVHANDGTVSSTSVRLKGGHVKDVCVPFMHCLLSFFDLMLLPAI